MKFDKLKRNTDLNSAPSASNSAPESSSSFTKKEPSGSSASSTSSGNLLSKDVKIKGKVKLNGDISIDGHIDGEITTKGVVTLNQNAVITAMVKAGTIIVHGKVSGNLEAADRIEILRTAEVQGDIKSAVLKVDAGAVFIGSSSIGKASTPAPKSSDNKSQDKPKGAPAGV